MKYAVILIDGAADYPIPELGGKTPLEAASLPNMDRIAREGLVGLVKTVPDSFSPGSDTANLSVMGYAPETCYTGRSPLEAVSMGIELAPDDVAMRCNLVTLSDTDRYEDAVMVDYSSGEITTEESTALVRDLAAALETDAIRLYPGISYRHCLVLKHAETGTYGTPPHDISGQPIAGHLPEGIYGEMLLDIQKRSREILKKHPVNLARIERGLNPATSCWFWGEGRKPALGKFSEVYGLDGAVVSAVDLIKGIGLCAGMESIDVPGATGTLESNFAGKCAAAVGALRAGKDFAYIHLEGPDECGHHADVEGKIKALERIDGAIVGPMFDYLSSCGEDFGIMVLPDHPTPISTRTHARDPIPFAMYKSAAPAGSGAVFNEKTGLASGLFLPDGPSLMRYFLA